MVRVYSTNALSIQRRNQRANREYWNAFRVSYGLPVLSSVLGSYNLTVAEALAEAAQLGIVQSAAVQPAVAQAPLAQPSMLQPPAAQPPFTKARTKANPKPKKRKVAELVDDDDEEDSENVQPNIGVATENKASCNLTSRRALAPSRVSKKIRVQIQEQEDGDLAGGELYYNDEEVNGYYEAPDLNQTAASSYYQARNGRNTWQSQQQRTRGHIGWYGKERSFASRVTAWEIEWSTTASLLDPLEEEAATATQRESSFQNEYESVRYSIQ